MSSMLANSEKRSPDGASQSKHISRSGSRVKKGTVLPPLSPEPPPLSVPRPLFSLPPLPSDRPLSVMDLPRLIAQVGPQRARGDTKWSEGPRMMASALGADIPIRAPDESTAHRYLDLNEFMQTLGMSVFTTNLWEASQNNNSGDPNFESDL